MKALFAVFTVLATISVSLPASAGVYGDDLTKCLVSSTSDTDRALLMRWIFSAIALKKELAPYVNMPAETRTKTNQEAAGLFMHLLTESCKTQTHDAYKYEGQAAINSAFQVLGQVASQGIFADPTVGAGMAGMTKYIDEQKLKAVIEAK